MKKYLLLSLIMTFTAGLTEAQQDLFRNSPIISPEIQTDNKVTFRLLAPDAKDVKIAGEWLPVQGFVRTPAVMAKGDSGVWTYTSPVLLSDLYTYSFTVDGVRCGDPNNAFVVRDVANISNLFIIGGGKGDLYKVNKVPHGTVSHIWYNSPGNGMVRRVTIYTPPGYENSKDKFPVFYLMHGIGGDEDAWMGLGRTSQILDNLIAQKKSYTHDCGNDEWKRCAGSCSRRRKPGICKANIYAAQHYGRKI
jgi:enterochelin esterase family protein